MDDRQYCYIDEDIAQSSYSREHRKSLSYRKHIPAQFDIYLHIYPSTNFLLPSTN